LRVFMIKANKLSKFFEYSIENMFALTKNRENSDILAELCLKNSYFRCIIIVQVEQSGD
jgi:hypothetical protein